jgi:hypothetical protein
MQSNDKATHLNPWLSSLVRIVLLVTLCYAVYQVQLKWLDFNLLDLKSPLLLGIALLLVPLNLVLEWMRFKKCMENAEYSQEALSKAFNQGLVLSFFTPALVATTLGRMDPSRKQNNAALLFSGPYNGLTQFAVTMGFATVGSFMLMHELPFNSAWVFGAVFLLSALLICLNPKTVYKIIKRVILPLEITNQQKASLIGLAALRFVVFSFQFHLPLQAFGQDFSAHQGWVLMLSYGLMALSPSILFGKIAIREAVAVAVFSFFLYPKEPLFIAAFLTWLFNVVLPLIFAVLRILFRWKSHYS